VNIATTSKPKQIKRNQNKLNKKCIFIKLRYEIKNKIYILMPKSITLAR